jgi:hypothetical protein
VRKGHIGDRILMLKEEGYYGRCERKRRKQVQDRVTCVP